MRKLLRFLSVAALLCVGYACSDEAQPADPFDVLSDDRTPTAFTLEGQQGVAVILDSSEDDAKGTILITVEAREVDVSSLVIENIRLPRGATATVERGSVLNLSSGSTTFTVTSESGKVRVYTIEYKEPARASNKSVLEFAVSGQINGAAQIVNDPEDDTKGSITIYLNTKLPDAAGVEITALAVSELAMASVAVGDKLNFSGYSTTFTVTADDTSVRTVTVTYIPVPKSDANTPTAFVVAGQVGGAVIAANAGDETKGTINLSISLDGLNVSALTINTLTLPAFATADKQVGGTINLSSGTATLAVTSESGKVRTFTITYTEIVIVDDPLIGKWKMFPRFAEQDWGTNAVIIAGGVQENANYLNLYDKNWSWQNGGDSGANSVQKVNKYTIEFVSTFVDLNAGIVGGTATLTAPDGFFNFIFGNGTDLNAKYQLIPKGTSTWKKNLLTGVITFYDTNDAVLGSCTLRGPGPNSETTDSGQTMTIGKTGKVGSESAAVTPGIYVFERKFTNNGDWWNGSDFYGDISRYSDNLRFVWWMVQKTE